MKRPITSASNLHRRKACPGSQRLEAQCPEIESDDSKEGTMLHELLAQAQKSKGAKEFTNVTDDQSYCLKFCLEKTKELEDLYINQDCEKLFRETETELFWMHPDNVFGHADLLAIDEDTALVIDYKFGRIPVDSAEANLQLRAYACMASFNHGPEKVIAAIIQPRVEANKRVTVVEYSMSDILAARAEIKTILEACEKPDAPLKPSIDACHYCRAKGICPALHQEANEIQLLDEKSITVRNAAEIYRKAKMVEKHVDAIKARVFLTVKSAVDMGFEVEGITLKPGTKRRVITNAQTAYHSVQHIISPEAFTAACSVKIGDLEEAFRAATGKASKAAKEELATLLNGCLELKTSEPSLVLTNE